MYVHTEISAGMTKILIRQTVELVNCVAMMNRIMHDYGMDKLTSSLKRSLIVCVKKSTYIVEQNRT